MNDKNNRVSHDTHNNNVQHKRRSTDIHDDKYNFGLLATMIVIGMSVNYWLGLERGLAYGGIMVACVLIWLCVAVADYFKRISKANDEVDDDSVDSNDDVDGSTRGDK